MSARTCSSEWPSLTTRPYRNAKIRYPFCAPVGIGPPLVRNHHGQEDAKAPKVQPDEPQWNRRCTRHRGRASSWCERLVDRTGRLFVPPITPDGGHSPSLLLPRPRSRADGRWAEDGTHRRQDYSFLLSDNRGCHCNRLVVC